MELNISDDNAQSAHFNWQFILQVAVQEKPISKLSPFVIDKPLKVAVS